MENNFNSETFQWEEKVIYENGEIVHFNLTGRFEKGRLITESVHTTDEHIRILF